jgi:hypothetical protein
METGSGLNDSAHKGIITSQAENLDPKPMGSK